MVSNKLSIIKRPHSKTTVGAGFIRAIRKLSQYFPGRSVSKRKMLPIYYTHIDKNYRNREIGIQKSRKRSRYMEVGTCIPPSSSKEARLRPNRRKNRTILFTNYLELTQARNLGNYLSNHRDERSLFN